MARKTAMVIAPGRGTYNKAELGYYARLHSDKIAQIEAYDAVRASKGQELLAALDGAPRYSLSKFSRGDNASGLIYACAYADFQSINRDEFEIIAVTGNSMGWYIALACSGVLDAMGGFEVVNTMGTFMHQASIGGQILYPFVNESWQEIPGRRAQLMALVDEIDGLYVSIHLGGMLVFAGTDEALRLLEDRLEPTQGRFPMRLANHGAFHSPLQNPVSEKGKDALPVSLFSQPDIPLIDGRGHVWWPQACDLQALHDYTLGEQVTTPYDFTRAVQNGIREFAPDAIIVLGPGTTLGGAVAQSMIGVAWDDLYSKNDFIARQKNDPYLLAMGLEVQRALTV